MGLGKTIGKAIWWIICKLPNPPDEVMVRFRVDATRVDLATPDFPNLHTLEDGVLPMYCEHWEYSRRSGVFGPRWPDGLFSILGRSKGKSGYPELWVRYNRLLLNKEAVIQFFTQAGFSLTLLSQEGEDLSEGSS